MSLASLGRRGGDFGDDGPKTVAEAAEERAKAAAREINRLAAELVAAGWNRSCNDEQTTKIDRTVWEFYKDGIGKHRWRASDINGNILAVSSQGYADKSDAETCARRFGWAP